jgi:hypothetical protein
MPAADRIWTRRIPVERQSAESAISIDGRVRKTVSGRHRVVSITRISGISSSGMAVIRDSPRPGASWRSFGV